MRAQLPTRISPAKTLIFASALFCVQQFQHTSLTFSLLFFAFTLLATMAFNVGGGFSRAAGSYIFFFATLVVGVGVFWKSVLGEAADSNLLVPQLDMAVYTVSMFMLLIVALASNKIFGKATGIARVESDYSLAAIGFLVLGVTQMVLNRFLTASPGSLLSIVNQLGQFFPLAMILGTISAITTSQGRRSVNFVSGLSIFITFTLGTLGFSKQGMFIPMACWLLGCLYSRLQLRVIHYIVIGSFIVFAIGLAPLISEGRDYISENSNYTQRALVLYDIVTHLQEAKEQENQTTQHELEVLGKSGYYDTPQGLISRFSMISVDDAFFNYTDKGNYIGYTPLISYYENLIPHIILPNKPVPIGGNYYAHKIGNFLAAEDETTGISFSPVPEAYAMGGWNGIFLVLPAIWLSLFVTIDYICGDFRRTPWGLLVIVVFAHSAPESLIGGLVWISGFGNLGLIVAILFATYFAPVVGALFSGGNRFAERASRPLDLSGEGIKPLTAPLLNTPDTWIK